MNDLTTTPKAHTAKGAARRSPSRSPEAHQPAELAVRSEDAVLYLQRVPSETTHGSPQGMTDTQARYEADILSEAEAILRKRWARLGSLSDPRASADWLRVHCAGMAAEVFGVIFLDSKYRILATRELFRGTLDGCSVAPREVVRAVIEANAAAVVLYHNHPSGNPEPSSADVAITQTLKQALDLIGCRVLDHLICGETVTSLSQRGLC